MHGLLQRNLSTVSHQMEWSGLLRTQIMLDTGPWEAVWPWSYHFLVWDHFFSLVSLPIWWSLVCGFVHCLHYNLHHLQYHTSENFHCLIGIINPCWWCLVMKTKNRNISTNIFETFLHHLIFCPWSIMTNLKQHESWANENLHRSNLPDVLYM